MLEAVSTVFTNYVSLCNQNVCKTATMHAVNQSINQQEDNQLIVLTFSIFKRIQMFFLFQTI